MGVGKGGSSDQFFHDDGDLLLRWYFTSSDDFVTFLVSPPPNPSPRTEGSTGRQEFIFWGMNHIHLDVGVGMVDDREGFSQQAPV